MMNTGSHIVKSSNKMLTTVAYQINGTTNYAIEGSVFIAGSLIQWLRDGLGIISKANEIELLAESESTNGGLTLIPALTGLGAPYWNPDAKGAIFGITRNTSKGHIARAALESIAIRTYEIILCMEKDANLEFSSLKVDGGASKNNLLMQIQSDLLQKEVIRPMITECTALGVAFMSGLSSGYWSSIEDLKKLNKKNDTFQPKESKQELLLKWNKHIKTLL